VIWEDKVPDFKLSTLAIIGLIGLSCWLTYMGVNILSGIEAREVRIEHAIEDMKKTDEDMKTLIEEALLKYEESLDMDRELWCLKAQQKNPSWECPSFERETYFKRQR